VRKTHKYPRDLLSCGSCRWGWKGYPSIVEVARTTDWSQGAPAMGGITAVSSGSLTGFDLI